VTEDDKQDPSAPGSSAADAAPTQEIPRIPKPASRPAKKTPAEKSAAAAKPPVTPTPAAATAATQTDKGRPRERPAPPPAASKSSAPAAPAAAPAKPSATAAATPPAGPSVNNRDASATGHPLTAADYARTTKTSPATTAVIPAVKERIEKVFDRDKKPKPTKTTKSGATLAPSPGKGTTRRASLRLTHVEPWSVTRLAFAISVAMMIVAVVAVTIFWIVLEATGVWDQINGSVTSVLSDDSSSFNITDYLGFGRLVGLTLVLSAINVVLMTALATIGAHLYNLAAQLLGGVEVTFAEEK
jgi:nitrogen fixation-related uncharacterized protein